MENTETEQESYTCSNHSAEVSELAERGLLMGKVTEVLRSLHFSGMESRQIRIVEAHYETFQWAWKAHFRHWMISSDFLFWVSGKPGSGKSTLMKHVFNKPETSQLLKEFCPRTPLEMESQNGSMHRKYLEHVSTLRIPPNDNTGPIKTRLWTWTFERCLDAFETVLRETQKTDKYCLFIDGLDEYEGDKTKLIDLIKHLQHFPNLKICVASRPWNIFEAAFGHNDTSKIYMQDLNAGDIQKYVNDRLEDHPEFQILRSNNEEVHELVYEIVEKSNGVFLWVCLVVKSLVEGLQNADRILDLKRRLHAFPADLNEFFQHILNSLDPIYKIQVVRGFKGVLKARNLSLIHFWYLDREEEEGLEYAIRMPIQSLSHSKVIQRSEARARIMTTRINGRFKGLLEVTQENLDFGSLTTNLIDIQSTVDFLHRTAKDS